MGNSKPRRHGTLAEYHNHHCRCEPCVLAMQTYRREYRRQVLAGERGSAVLRTLRAAQARANLRQRQNRTPEFRARIGQYQKAYHARRAAQIAQVKASPCADCGGRFPPECMDFDHRPGTIKAFNLGGKRSIPWKRLEAEMAKCDVVCANCHRTRTVNRRKAKANEKNR